MNKNSPLCTKLLPFFVQIVNAPARGGLSRRGAGGVIRGGAGVCRAAAGWVLGRRREGSFCRAAAGWVLGRWRGGSFEGRRGGVMEGVKRPIESHTIRRGRRLDVPKRYKCYFYINGGTPSPLRPLASRVESYRLRYSALLSRALAPSLRKNITP